MPDFHIELYDLFKPGLGTPRVLRALDIEPRAHGKSKRWSVIYPLWVILTDPDNIGFANIDFMLISATASRAEDFLMEIGAEINGNPLLKADWGNQLGKAKRDNSSDKILNNGARIRAKGAGAQVRGDHPTYLVIDDLEDAEEAQNPDLRAKLNKWFREDLYGTLLESSSMFLVGTIVNSESLLAELHKDDTGMTSGWIKRRYAAIKEDGTALWPTKWSLERLDKRRGEVGELAFSQEYLNQPLTSENPTIRVEWIQYTEKIPHRRDMYCVTAVDFAHTEKKQNDFTAVVTVGVVTAGDDKGKMYVCEKTRGHWSPQDACRAFLDQADAWKSAACVWEAYGPAVSMKYDVDRVAAQRNRHYNLKKYAEKKVHTVKGWVTADKVTRAASVASMFENGYIYFQKAHRDVVAELLLLPNGAHDDMADALIHALMEIQRQGYTSGKTRTKGKKADMSYVNATVGY